MNSERSGDFLDPLAFPAETDARFNLLIFGAVITVLSLSITMWATMTLGSNLSRWDLRTFQPTQVQNWRIILFVIGAPFIGSLSVVSLLGLGYYKYRAHPARIISQKHLEPLKPERDGKFIDSVESLAKGAGLKTIPAILIGPPRAQDGQAFGFRDMPILRLGPNLKVMRLKKELEPIYRAITLHEMAHIFNEDIQRSYFAEATWRALRIMMVPLAALTVLGYLPAMQQIGLSLLYAPIVLLPVTLMVAFGLGIIFAVLQFIRRSALRVREVYADLRAGQWGASEGLVQILSTAHANDKNWWQRLWEYHPKASERLKYLQNPQKLFHVTLDLPISLGFLSGVVLASCNLIFNRANQLYRNSSSGIEGLLGLTTLVVIFLVYPGITFLLSWLAANGIGMQIQRQSVAERGRGISGMRPYSRLLPPALAFHVACEAGVYLMPYDTIQVDPSTFLLSIVGRILLDPAFPISSSSLTSFLIFPFWILFAALTLWFWMGLIRFYSGRLVAVTPGPAPSFGGMRSITVIAALLLPVLYIPAALARYWLLDLGNRSILPVIASLPVVFTLVLIICLAGWVWLRSRVR